MHIFRMKIYFLGVSLRPLRLIFYQLATISLQFCCHQKHFLTAESTEVDQEHFYLGVPLRPLRPLRLKSLY